MRKFFGVLLLSFWAVFPAFAEPVPSAAPLSKRYQEWQDYQLERQAAMLSGDISDDKYKGYVPFPIDLSYLADNPPDMNLGSPFPNNKAGNANDTTYDLRTDNYLTSVKDQSPYETCWAHAAIAALESSYLTSNSGTASENVNFSEMMLVWFARINQDKSRSFSMFNRNETHSILQHYTQGLTAQSSKAKSPTAQTNSPQSQRRRATPELCG